MALSDDLLKTPKKLRTLRRELASAVETTGARAAFLLDEAGEPFATVGTIEFTLPNPMASHAPLLSALVGEGEDATEAETPYLVRRVSKRALVVLAFGSSADAAAQREHVAPLVAAIKSFLDT